MNPIKIIVLPFFVCLVLSSQAQGDKKVLNQIVLSAENIPDRTATLHCIDHCWRVDSLNNLVLTLEGTLRERSIRVSIIVAAKKGNTKIKIDKDGDLLTGQKLDIEIFGSNPAIDKQSYSIEDEKDEAVVTITSFDINRVSGTFYARFFDSATDTRKLTATCKFAF